MDMTRRDDLILLYGQTLHKYDAHLNKIMMTDQLMRTHVMDASPGRLQPESLTIIDSLAI